VIWEIRNPCSRSAQGRPEFPPIIVLYLYFLGIFLATIVIANFKKINEIYKVMPTIQRTFNEK
jgi:hypothetical protein